MMRPCLLILVVAALIGCDRAKATAASDRERVTWLCPVQLDRPVLDALAAEFRQANPQIDLELLWVPGAQYQTKLKTLIAAGQPPDILSAGDVWLAYLLPFLADLSQFYERDASEMELDDVLPEIRRACQWNGKYRLVPRFFNVSLLYYNRSLFDASGEPYPTAQWTWDEYMQAAKHLTKRDSQGRVSVWGTQIVTGWWGEWLMLVRQCGGEMFNDDLTECRLDSPEAIRALKFYRDKVHRERVAPAPGFGPDQGFASGKLAMELGGHTGNWTAYNQIPGLQWDIELLPAGPKTRAGGELALEAVGISTGSRHVEAAWKFLKFLLSRRSVEAHAKAGYLSVRRSVAEEFWLSPARTSQPRNVRAAYEALKYGQPIPRSPDFIEIALDVIQPEIDRMLVSDVDAETAGRRATEAANRFLRALGSARREDVASKD